MTTPPRSLVRFEALRQARMAADDQRYDPAGQVRNGVPAPQAAKGDMYDIPPVPLVDRRQDTDPDPDPDGYPCNACQTWHRTVEDVEACEDSRRVAS